MSKRILGPVLLAVVLAVAPAAALVRFGVGGGAGFAFPVAAFDAEAKTAPAAAVRVYGNLFHWLTLEAGADYHLPHGAESDTGDGETRLVSFRAGLIYKVDMGVFKPYLAGGPAFFAERIRHGDGWDDYDATGFYVTPGLEYYFDEPFLAWGAFGYNRIFDGARGGGRDSQYVKLDFGVAYFLF